MLDGAFSQPEGLNKAGTALIILAPIATSQRILALAGNDLIAVETGCGRVGRTSPGRVDRQEERR